MAAQWPAVVTQLLTVLPTLPGWSQVGVFDGVAYDSVPAIYCTVGHQSDGIQSRAGNYTTAQSPDGYRWVESGQVAGQLVSTDSNPEQATDRVALFTLMTALETWMRAHRTLGGVLSAEGTSNLTVEIDTTQTVPGSSYSLSFAVAYTTIT